MRRTIINDPENPIRRSIGLLAHHLFHKPVKRGDAGLRLAPTDYPGSVNVPGSQIVQSASTLIFVFNVGRTTLGGRQGAVLANSGLNAGLLVSRQHEFVRAERPAAPETLVKVENRSSLLNKLGITGEDPTAMAPGTYGVAAQPSPESTATDLGDDALSKHFGSDVGDRKT
jgi:hypothetical protein